MAGKKSAQQTMEEWLARQQQMIADPQFQDDVMANGTALAGMAKENIGRSADMAMNAGNKLGSAMEADPYASGAGTALRQGIYDMRTGGQPAAPYVDANSMVDSMSGTIGANAELPNMMKKHGGAHRGIGIANKMTEQLQQQQMQQQQEMQAIAMKLQEAGIPVTSETVQKAMEQKKMMGGFLQEKAGQGMDVMRGLLQ